MRYTQTDFAKHITIFFILILGMFLFIKLLPYIGEKTSNKALVRCFYETDIPKYDLAVLSELKADLKVREGLRLTPYSDGKHEYIGFGHLILKGEKFTCFDSVAADSLLDVDVFKAYREVKRIQNKKLYNNVKQVFISGHLK